MARHLLRIWDGTLDGIQKLVEENLDPRGTKWRTPEELEAFRKLVAVGVRDWVDDLYKINSLQAERLDIELATRAEGVRSPVNRS